MGALSIDEGWREKFQARKQVVVVAGKYRAFPRLARVTKYEYK